METHGLLLVGILMVTGPVVDRLAGHSEMPIRTDPLRVLARIGRRAIAACFPARSNRSPLRMRRHYPRLRTASIHTRSGQRTIQPIAMDTQHPEQ